MAGRIQPKPDSEGDELPEDEVHETLNQLTEEYLQRLNAETDGGYELELSPGEEQLYELAEERTGLRDLDEIKADIAVLAGPAALSHTAEQRHDITLILLDDLLEARALLATFDEAFAQMRPGR